jgi:class 3 adenylate cyclase
MGNLEHELKSKSPLALVSLGRALKARDSQDPDVLDAYRAISHLLIKRGEPLLAFALIDEGRDRFPNDQRLRQLLGLALARSGATRLAHGVLDELHAEELSRAPGTTSEEVVGREETLSILGRTYKDFGLESWPNDRTAAIRHWEKALQLYLAAYSLRMNYYPAINAAAVATFLGRGEIARHLAEEVRRLCLGVLDRVHAGQIQDDLYWLNATLGEACLIRKELNEAALWYGHAAQLGQERRDFGSMGSTLRQLKYLAEFLALSPADVSAIFPMPRVAVFTGHMIDRPGRSQERFPQSLADRVAEEIRAWLDREDIRVGFSSAACGADLLFLEALLARGGETHVILPFDPRVFCESSVAIGGKPWVDRYERVLERSLVETVSDRPLKFGEVAYDHANQIIHGLAIMHSDRLSTELRRLAVWDGQPGDGSGGTSDVVFQWQQSAQTIDVISVPDVQPPRSLEALGWTTRSPHASRRQLRDDGSTGFGSRVVAMLFADVVGFSKMNEDQMPVFVGEFLSTVANLLDHSRTTTLKRNTWGDGLFLVFEGIGDAGRYALELADCVRSTDWKSKGLPENLGLRTALHAGPVYLCTDPVTQLANCIGTHVSHTARIEPITPANEVYASEAFAALAVAQGITEFTCHYVGHLHLAKKHGVHATYHLTRRTDEERG